MKTKLEQIKDKLIEIEQAEERDDVNKKYNELENLFDDGSIWWLVERVQELEEKLNAQIESNRQLDKINRKWLRQNKRYREALEEINDMTEIPEFFREKLIDVMYEIKGISSFALIEGEDNK